MIITKYYEALNLERNPFSLALDLDFYYLMSSHVEAIDTVFFAFDNGSPMVRLYGEPGTGKTMLLKHLSKKFEEKYSIKVVNITYNPLMDVKEFCKFIFGVDGINDLDGLIKDFLSRTERLVIFVDEAQDMEYSYFLFLKYLIDLSSVSSKVFVLLSGTPILKRRFSEESLIPLAQRSPYHCELYGLKKDEIKGYIEHRLRRSGYSGDIPFKDKAIKYIYKLTKGNPRKVNILSERSMLAAMVKGKRQVGKREVKEAYKDISSEVMSGVV